MKSIAKPQTMADGTSVGFFMWRHKDASIVAIIVP